MQSDIPTPPFRRLRGYAIDPGLSTQFQTRLMNQLVYKVKWEQLEPREQPGAEKKGGSRTEATCDSYPAGEYLEIVDFDPATGRFYEPVNLDHPHLLAQDGLQPSVSNPQFHQQMVYAVMMTTIENFERALGRKIMWAENIPVRPAPGQKKLDLHFQFVRRLRVYPHALRQANAYYDPIKKAMLFGYFNSAPANAQIQLPGATVFTCLSHDIIAHETTHALIDGLHRRYIDATHPDTRAFHEAFADIVALFQHFSFPEVLRHQVAQTRGDLRQQNLLGQLAQQFGQAIGGYGGLRDAIGEFDKDGVWKQKIPNAQDYANEMECHKRGAILVAAVFDAFLTIYESRVQKLMRIATGDARTPTGDLHPDLVDEIAKAAAKSASDVLRICIRALDYCPPMDLTYGDYLRALITADHDMVAEDTNGYRVAFIEAFQKRGISGGIKNMAVEELVYPLCHGMLDAAAEQSLGEHLRNLKNSVGYLTDRQELYAMTKDLIRGDRKQKRQGLHGLIEDVFVSGGSRRKFADLTGLMFPPNDAAAKKLGLEWAYITTKSASYAIGNVWLANRVTPDGNIVNHVVMTLVQKRGVRFKVNGKTVNVDEKGFFVPDSTPEAERGPDHIIFRGGCTLIFDLDTRQLHRVIKKDIDDHERMVLQYKFQHGLLGETDETYFSSQTMNALAGPFAFMHSHDH